MNPDSRAVETERRKVLHDLERWIETPMLILAFVWLGLVIVEAMWGAMSWSQARTNGCSPPHHGRRAKVL